MTPWISALAVGCATTYAAPAGSDARQPVPVVTHGALRAIMHEGDTAAKVKLTTVLQPGVVAVGALEGLRGEVTVDNGRLWLSVADGRGGIATERPTGVTDAQATLLVSATVEHWAPVVLSEPTDLAGLGDRIVEAAGALGLPAGPHPFRIEGDVVDLRYHVVDGSKLPAGPASHAAHKSSGVQVSHDRARATLIGFWSTDHEGVFTHMGDRVHVHVTTEQPLGSGHVDAVTVPAGTMLLLPAP